MIALTPETLERVKRMAEEQKKTPEQILAEAVLIMWVRFATAKGLMPGEW